MRPLLVLPPPVPAARATFLEEDALPIAAERLAGRPRLPAPALQPVVGAGHAGPYRQAGPDDGQTEPFGAAERLAGEPEDRTVMGHDHPVGVLIRRDALEMEHFAGRLQGDRPTGAPRPPAQIQVLHVHEKRLVEAVEVLPRFAADQETRPRDPVDPLLSRPVPVEQLVARGETVLRS